MRFGRIVLGTLAGAFLATFFAHTSITDCPTLDVLYAERWFAGAAVGACLVIVLRTVPALYRGHFRACLSKSLVVELVVVCLIMGGLAQNWRDAQLRLDDRHERLLRYTESRARGDSPNAAGIDFSAAETERSLASSAIHYLGIAAAAAGSLIVVYRLFADLASLDVRLPVPVRNAVAMALVGLILFVGLGLYFVATACLR